MFSFGFSFSSPPFLHRIRVRVDIEVEGLEARCRAGQRHLPVERDLGSQAGNLVAVLGEHVGENGVGALANNQYSTAPGLTTWLYVQEESPWVGRRPL
jgi:hypothetical protein